MAGVGSAECQPGAARTLDALAVQANTSTTMQTDVDNIVHGITRKDQTLVGHLRASDLELRQGEEHTPTTHEILFELEYVSFLGWLLWALLTFVLGVRGLDPQSPWLRNHAGPLQVFPVGDRGSGRRSARGCSP